jgi:hypothetical protein
MAVVASILTAIYRMLKDGTMCHDLGCGHRKCTPPISKKAPGQALSGPRAGLLTDRYAAAGSPDNMDKLCCG